MKRTIDLDVDIGADAVDYKFVGVSRMIFLYWLMFLLVPLRIKSLFLDWKQKCENWKA
jgi:hypothetical protein